MNSWLLLQINAWAGRDRLLDAVALFCAQYLIYVVFVVALAWFALALHQRTFRPAAFFVVNLIVAFILLQIASHAYVEARPFVTHHVTQLLPHAADQSFPSDHTTAASAIAFGFMLFTKYRKTGIVLLIAALAIGMARVFAGVHYPADIGGGVATSMVAAAIVYTPWRIWWSRPKPRPGREPG